MDVPNLVVTVPTAVRMRCPRCRSKHVHQVGKCGPDQPEMYYFQCARCLEPATQQPTRWKGRIIGNEPDDTKSRKKRN